MQPISCSTDLELISCCSPCHLSRTPRGAGFCGGVRTRGGAGFTDTGGEYTRPVAAGKFGGRELRASHGAWGCFALALDSCRTAHSTIECECRPAAGLSASAKHAARTPQGHPWDAGPQFRPVGILPGYTERLFGTVPVRSPAHDTPVRAPALPGVSLPAEARDNKPESYRAGAR